MYGDRQVGWKLHIVNNQLVGVTKNDPDSRPANLIISIASAAYDFVFVVGASMNNVSDEARKEEVCLCVGRKNIVHFEDAVHFRRYIEQ